MLAVKSVLVNDSRQQQTRLVRFHLVLVQPWSSWRDFLENLNVWGNYELLAAHHDGVYKICRRVADWTNDLIQIPHRNLLGTRHHEVEEGMD